MSFIYLASPYTHEEPAMMELRYFAACTAVAELMEESGRTVYSPIVHFHPVAQRSDLPTDFNYFQRHNIAMLRHAEQFAVLQLPGWDTSRGVQAEIKVARKLHLRTHWLIPSPDVRGIF